MVFIPEKRRVLFEKDKLEFWFLDLLSSYVIINNKNGVDFCVNLNKKHDVLFFVSKYNLIDNRIYLRNDLWIFLTTKLKYEENITEFISCFFEKYHNVFGKLVALNGSGLAGFGAGGYLFKEKYGK